MKVLFNSNISQINVYEKSYYFSSLTFKRGKRQVGTKFGIFPIYESVEGLFYYWDDKYWGTVEEYNTLERNTYFEVGEFYYKPYCVIHTNSGKANTVYFETVSQLLDYVDELKDFLPHIIIK